MADAGPESHSSPPLVPRQKLPELYALAAVREEAFANGTAPPPGVTLLDPDTHRGRAAGYEAASTALQSHRRLADTVDVLRRLLQRFELRADDAIYPMRWRLGYIEAVDEALHTIERTLTAAQADVARERRLERRVMRLDGGL